MGPLLPVIQQLLCPLGVEGTHGSGRRMRKVLIIDKGQSLHDHAGEDSRVESGIYAPRSADELVRPQALSEVIDVGEVARECSAEQCQQLVPSQLDRIKGRPQNRHDRRALRPSIKSEVDLDRLVGGDHDSRVGLGGAEHVRHPALVRGCSDECIHRRKHGPRLTSEQVQIARGSIRQARSHQRGPAGGEEVLALRQGEEELRDLHLGGSERIHRDSPYTAACQRETSGSHACRMSIGRTIASHASTRSRPST